MTLCPPPTRLENTPCSSTSWPFCSNPSARLRRHARFHDHVASAERQLRHARRLERRLDVHPLIDDVADELRVRLRLIPAAHDAEGDSHLVLRHEAWNDRVERPLARLERVRVGRVDAEETTAALKHEPRALRNQARSPVREVALDERHDVAVAIDDAQVRRVAAFGRQRARDGLRIRALRIDFARAPRRIRLR